MVCVNEHGNFRCGKCFPCLTLRKREWMARIIMETKVSSEAYFLTLTYNPEHLPHDPESFLPTLKPEHTTKYLKRLRKAGLTFRYFLVGEYGDKSQRPHYHAILFFKEPAPADIEEICFQKWSKPRKRVQSEESMGFISLKPYKTNDAAYVAGYVLKKSLGDHQPNGVHPEFTRMSRRPGLGLGYSMENLVDSSRRISEITGDIPRVIRTEGHILPLDRTVQRKLRDATSTEHTVKERLNARRATGKSLAPLYRPEITDAQRHTADAYHSKMVRRQLRGYRTKI